MKNTIKFAATLICLVAIIVNMESCIRNNDRGRAVDNQRPQQINQSQESISKPQKPQQAVQPQEANRISESRFKGRYIFLGGEWESAIEVLPDGRVIRISHVIATGQETKEYIGDIIIISEDAFMIETANYGVSVCSSNSTPIYLIRNGVETNIGWTTRDGIAVNYSLVFDISENRAYLGGIQKYRNRDIGEVEYVKFRRR